LKPKTKIIGSVGLV